MGEEIREKCMRRITVGIYCQKNKSWYIYDNLG
jgi:hypothetical protein